MLQTELMYTQAAQTLLDGMTPENLEIMLSSYPDFVIPFVPHEKYKPGYLPHEWYFTGVNAAAEVLNKFYSCRIIEEVIRLKAEREKAQL